jgi:hypothetical protein
LEDRHTRTVINVPISRPFRPTAVRASVALLGLFSGLYFAYSEYRRLSLYPAFSYDTATANLGIFSGLLLALISGWYLKHKFDQKYEIVLS